MAREEIGITRVHIDLVGATNVGTTMAKGFTKPKVSKSKAPKAKHMKVHAKEKNIAKAIDDAKKGKGKPLAPPPKKKP